MTKIRLLTVLGLALVLAGMLAQTTYQSPVLKGTADSHNAAKTLPHRTGTGSPNARDACATVGETYFQTDATAGSNSWGCTTIGTPGTWTLQGSGGGGGGGLLPWNPTASTPPVLASWTQINTGANGVFANVTGGVLVDSVSGNNIKGLYVATPGASGSAFTITGHVSGTCPTTDTNYGLLIGDASANYISWGCKNGSAGTGLGTCYNQVLHTNNTGVPQSAPFQSNPIFTPDPGWLRMQYDGTNISMQVSATGADAASWLPLFSETAASGLAANPSRIGIVAYPSAGSGHCINTLGYWLVTQP